MKTSQVEPTVRNAVLNNIRNGIRKPGLQDHTSKVWSALNKFVEFDLKPTALTARTLAAKNDWDVNSTVVVFHCWNKYNS